jgi:hypothetical protein
LARIASASGSHWLFRPAVEPVVEMAGFVWQGSSKPTVEMAGFAKRKYRQTVSRLSPSSRGRLRGLAAASGFAPLGISEAFHPAVILSIQNQISSAEATDIAAVLLRSPFWPIGRGT